MNNLMIDIETLGKAPGSVILSIGAVWFDAATGEFGDEYYAAINPQSAISSGLRMDVSTVQWWMSQTDEARAAAFSGERILSWALGEFGDFVRKSEVKRIWAKPPSFDLVLLEAAFAACSIPIPWEYWTPRDCRTLFEISNVKQAAFGTKHNALDDAKSQAAAVIEAYRVLGLSTSVTPPTQEMKTKFAAELMDQAEKCPICEAAFKPDDICATDIELGICHAACLEGSPVVDLDTGEPLPEGAVDTYRFGDSDTPTAPKVGLRGIIDRFEKAYPELYWHVAKGKISAGEPLYGAAIFNVGNSEMGHGESDESAEEAFRIAVDDAGLVLAPAEADHG